MRTSTALEGVYQWNQLLSSARPDLTLKGIVVNYEEHAGFEAHLPRIPEFRKIYSPEGQPLRFGTAVGFDNPLRASSVSKNIDDVYLEMYDSYVEDTKPAELVQQGAGRLTNNITKTLQVLDRDVWGPYLKHYAALPNVHFMWSLQAKSSSDCRYPIGESRRCGTKDDLGGWEATRVAEFVNTVKDRYTGMRNKPRGFFEFSYMPTSWLQCLVVNV